MTRPETSPYATVLDDRQLTGRPIVLAGAGPLGGDVEVPEPLVTGAKKWTDVDQDICLHTEQFPTRLWWIAFAVALSMVGVLGFALASLFYSGMGIAGVNQPVGWGSFIINFVFWIGIGHAGTLISAVLYLFRQQWRTGINRAAEAMTLFAVACAGIFPIIHLGRPWFAYWLVPYPNARGPLWVNFNSPLAWDIFAISTYGLVSLTFWYMGLLPDLATVRDRATHPWRRRLYNALSFGWTGSHRAWRHYESAYMILAAFATPLVFSVHTIVSFDFATSVMPGWHATIFPPYFVIGAIFSGFAMVITLMSIMRGVFNLKHYITLNHMEAMAKVLLLTGMLVGFAYTHRVLHGLVLGERVGGLRLQEPGLRPVRLGLRDHVHLQRHRAPALLVEEPAPPPGGAVRGLDPGERGHVLRALRDRGHLAAPRLPAVVLGDVPLHLLGLRHPDRLVRPLLHAVPAVRAGAPGGRHLGGEGRDGPEGGAERPARPASGAPRRRGGAAMSASSTSGVIGYFLEPSEALAAAAKTRDAGWKHFDFLTPFPIHGMEEAMGQKPSWIPYVTAVLAFVGILLAQALQNYVMVYDWPLNFGGKPHASWPSFVPITFEAMVFWAAIGTAIVAIVAGKVDSVPQPPPLLVKTGATVDRFVLWISATDPEWDAEEAVEFVRSLGAHGVELVEAGGETHA